MYCTSELELSEGIWLSGKKLDCRPRDCEFDPPSLQQKLLKKEVCTGSSQENAPVCHCSRYRTWLVCHVWWHSSILHYGPQIVTNNLYAPTRNGKKPECIVKQKQYPPPPHLYSCGKFH